MDQQTWIREMVRRSVEGHGGAGLSDDEALQALSVLVEVGIAAGHVTAQGDLVTAPPAAPAPDALVTEEELADFLSLCDVEDVGEAETMIGEAEEPAGDTAH